MALFIKSDKDPEGQKLRVENAFRGADGKFYLLLHRLPPEYTKPPTFLVELSDDKVQVRGEGHEIADIPAYYKAYAYQVFSRMEIKFLRGAQPGSPVAPFFNFSYPNVLRVLGKQFSCLSDEEAAKLAHRCNWKLIGDQRH